MAFMSDKFCDYCERKIEERDLYLSSKNISTGELAFYHSECWFNMKEDEEAGGFFDGR